MSTPSAVQAVPHLDPVASARWLRRSRVVSPWLHEEVASRMLARLDWFRREPSDWLHWEPMLGGLQAHRQLRARWPDAPCHVAAVDRPAALAATREDGGRRWNPLSWGRGRGPQACEDGTQVDLLWANMLLHHVPEPQACLQTWHRHLRPDGVLLFSCLGPDTLSSLRTLYARLGWPAPMHPLTDMHDLGDMLVQAGFAEPVMDMERLTLTFSGPEALLQELRGLGRNLHRERFAQLRGRSWRERLFKAIATELPRDAEGRLCLDFEIVYGHALRPTPRVKMAADTAVPLDRMREMLRASRRP